ncbi:MAG: alpha-amylase family glycosyl hydrolase, partial [Myxococcota bacterium]
MATEPEHLRAVAETRFGDPHRWLGRHREDATLVFRVLAPHAEAVAIRWDGVTRTAARREDVPEVFQLRWETPSDAAPGAYLVVIDGEATRDPYAFSPTLGAVDLHLIGEGTHRELDRVLGAHPRTHQSVAGLAFTVWAPEAVGVSVTGDFNDWRTDRHPMRRLDGGVWELFIPGLGAEGTRYKYAIRVRDEDQIVYKADPFSRGMELRPHTASVVVTSRHVWNDHAWMAHRRRPSRGVPVSVYEVHLGSWRHRDDTMSGAPSSSASSSPPWLGYRALAHDLVDYVVDLGFTHVELMPILEHPFDGSWGYQVGSYFAPTRRYGSPDDLRYFVDRCHQQGLGVLLDWVPAHFPKDAFALGRFDGSALYEHLDPRQGEHRQWGTYVFNYGRAQVTNFLVANALYWLREFHFDGLRCDAVASMLYLDYGADDPG